MLSFATISHPVSEDSPCGPDPELDPEILNFLAVAEGQLPATYREFNRKGEKPFQAYVGMSRDSPEQFESQGGRTGDI